MNHIFCFCFSMSFYCNYWINVIYSIEQKWMVTSPQWTRHAGCGWHKKQDTNFFFCACVWVRRKEHWTNGTQRNATQRWKILNAVSRSRSMNKNTQLEKGRYEKMGNGQQQKKKTSANNVAVMENLNENHLCPWCGHRVVGVRSVRFGHSDPV